MFTNKRLDFLLVPGILLTVLLVPQSPWAFGSSAYDSGYNHGCDDAGLSPSDRYINEPGKGKSHHTPDFNRGYNAGFSSCGSSSGGSSSGESDGGGQNEGRSPGTDQVCNLHPAMMAGCTIVDELTK